MAEMKSSNPNNSNIDIRKKYIEFMEYNEYLRTHENIVKLDPNDLPTGLFISTMTILCAIPVTFNVLNIARNLELSENFIRTVKCGNNNEICRTLKPIKIKNRRIAKNKNFYNQVTIVVASSSNHDENYDIRMNIKLFRNGSMQITGCKKISSTVWAIDMLMRTLRMGKYVFVNSNMKHIQYGIPYFALDIESVRDFRIVMINSDFNTSMVINKDVLYKMLSDDKYECVLDAARHSGVIIKYKTIEYENIERVVTIIVFDKGSIMITGARDYRQIMECYVFINTYLLEKYSKQK
jgi:TATA-box binding protein (TBP) (component of TFIID and TFIIIB)